MSEEFKYDIFLSHSFKDKAVARKLATRLEADGLRVWFDEWLLNHSERAATRRKKMKRALGQSRAFVLCVSRSATAAEWNLIERYTGRFPDPVNAQGRFILLRLDDAEIKGSFEQFPYVDFKQKSDEQYANLLAACRTAIIAKVLKGHASAVNGVAVSADGHRAVSCSYDETVRVWDLEAGACVAMLKGHIAAVNGVAVSADGHRAVSGSTDNTVRVWDLEAGTCVATFEDHTSTVWGVAMTADGHRAVSGSANRTVRVWDLEAGTCVATLEGHTDSVMGVAVTADGHRAVSGSADNTVRVWDLEAGTCVATLEGHTSIVWGVAITADGHRAVSGSADNTVRVWDLEAGTCVATLEGCTSIVMGVAVSADGHRAVSCSYDETLRVWDLEAGTCVATLEGHTSTVRGVAVTADGHRAISGSADKTVRVWDLPPYDEKITEESESARYTNAKVVLVGESGVGKTGLALRLCEDRWEATESTHGMIISQLKFATDMKSSDIEREVWLWDFAGQPDYRLIHQLYMDETALGVLVFDPQDDDPFDALGHWEKALQMAAKARGITPAKLLVAARCDRGGITVSKKRFDEYCQQRGFAGLWLTGAKTSDGCEELKAAIAAHIPWDRLPYISTTKLFKSLKDALLKLKEEDAPLVRLPELRQRIKLLLPDETISADSLRTVVGLMQGQGVVQMLDFGDFVLLQPEQINRYASIVVRMARKHVDEMGAIPEQQVLDGRLDYKDMTRLADADEKILLRAMAQTFLDRALCLRETTPAGIMLVFPSYFRRDRPEITEYPNVFVTYGFAGPLDEIYATLVVKLIYSGGFEKDQLWKDAADFKTPGGKRVGFAMRKKPEGTAALEIYFEPGVPDDTKVMFIKYVHEHLLARGQDVTRVRAYICPHCDTPLENRKAIEIRLKKGFKDIICSACEERVVLIDLIEEKFASDEFARRVREMDEQARINLDNESRELILVGHAYAIAGEAGQIYRQYTNSDHGIDGEIEFKDHEGSASGKRLYLQLKSGDSYLTERKKDGAEIFRIKEDRWADYWQQHAYPVMLVIRTSDGKIRWMNVSGYLKRHSAGGKQVKQIIFDGEPFTAPNLRKMRDKLFPIKS